ncbi:hypothetical protein, partial [Paracoccus sp. NSM]|uniref:hypothetical protein n=1 Tax=Paracoccus sp. NSM TaxID=3457784 RepID=UPI004035C18F
WRTCGPSLVRYVARPGFPSAATHMRDRRRRSGRKTLVQRAQSGDLAAKRQATWGMSANYSNPMTDVKRERLCMKLYISSFLPLAGLLSIFFPTFALSEAGCNFSIINAGGAIGYEGEPCNLLDAIYVSNHINPVPHLTPHLDLPLPDVEHMALLGVQMFIYREHHIDEEMRNVDHLIVSTPYISEMGEERFASYHAYTIYNYAMQMGATDPLGTIRETVSILLSGSGHGSLAELLCFVELDHPNLDRISLQASSQYAACLDIKE